MWLAIVRVDSRESEALLCICAAVLTQPTPLLRNRILSGPELIQDLNTTHATKHAME